MPTFSTTTHPPSHPPARACALGPPAAGFAYTNGSFVPNPARQGAATCVDPQGSAVPCCAWQPEPWAVGFIAVAGLLMLWTVLLANQIRVFVISGAIAQW
jgi:hypothetical protein